MIKIVRTKEQLRIYWESVHLSFELLVTNYEFHDLQALYIDMDMDMCTNTESIPYPSHQQIMELSISESAVLIPLIFSSVYSPSHAHLFPVPLT